MDKSLYYGGHGGTGQAGCTGRGPAGLGSPAGSGAQACPILSGSWHEGRWLVARVGEPVEEGWGAGSGLGVCIGKVCSRVRDSLSVDLASPAGTVPPGNQQGPGCEGIRIQRIKTIGNTKKTAQEGRAVTLGLVRGKRAFIKPGRFTGNTRRNVGTWMEL